MTSQPTSTYWVVPQTLSTVLETELVNRMTEVLMNAMEQGATEFNGSRSEPADYFDEIIREFQCVEYNNKDAFGVFKGGSFVELNHKMINRLKGLIADIDKQLKIYISRSGQDLVREFVGLMFDHDKFQSHITVDWMEAMVKVGMREGTNKPLIHKLFKAILTYIGVLLSGEYEFDTAKLEEGLLGMSNYKPVSISSRSRSRSISTKSEPPKPKRVVRRDPSEIDISDDEDDDRDHYRGTPDEDRSDNIGSMIKDCNCRDKYCHHEYPRYTVNKKDQKYLKKRVMVDGELIPINLDLFNPSDPFVFKHFTDCYKGCYIGHKTELKDTWFYYDMARVLAILHRGTDRAIVKASVTGRTEGIEKIRLSELDSFNDIDLIITTHGDDGFEYKPLAFTKAFAMGKSEIIPKCVDLKLEPYLERPDNSMEVLNVSRSFARKIVDFVSPQVTKYFNSFLKRHFCSFKDYAATTEYKLKFLKSWIAKPFIDIKNPRTNILMVIIGEGGDGKTTLADLISKLYGSHMSTTLQSTERILGKFNSELMNKYFVVCDDAAKVGEGSGVSHTAFVKIKTMIAGETVKIELKGKDVVTARNCMNFMFTSNDPRPVIISDSGFMRRIAVYRSNADGRTSDSVYWSEVNRFFYGSIVVDGEVVFVGVDNITHRDETVLDHLFTYLVKFREYEKPSDIIEIKAFANIIPQTNDYINLSIATGSLVHRFKTMMASGMFKKWFKRMRNTDNEPMERTVDGKKVWVIRSSALWALYQHYSVRTANTEFTKDTKAATFYQKTGGLFHEGPTICGKANVTTRIIPDTWNCDSAHDIDDPEFDPPEDNTDDVRGHHRTKIIGMVDPESISKNYKINKPNKGKDEYVEPEFAAHEDPESEYSMARARSETREEASQIDTSESSVSRVPSERKRVSRSRSRQ